MAYNAGNLDTAQSWHILPLKNNDRQGNTVKNDNLKIPKKLFSVTLWVHPEGRVKGSLFLRYQSPDYGGTEQPLDLLNRCEAFLVFMIDSSNELRFYNIKSVIRVEYQENDEDEAPSAQPMQCHLQMMDGSLIHGTIQETLPPDHARLLDYLNQAEENFIKVHMEDGLIYLINKSYINHVQVAGIGESEGGN